MAKSYLLFCVALVCIIGVCSCQQKSNNSNGISKETNKIKLVDYQKQSLVIKKYQEKPQDELLEEAKSGDANAMFELAQRAYNSSNKEEAFKYYLAAAQKGHSKAQWRVGGCYMEGAGVEKDMSEAKRWSDLSVENGDPSGAYAVAFYHTIGTPQTPYEKNGIKAIELAQAALDAGNYAAYEVLGDVYYWGINVERDISKGLSYYEKGADAGNANCEAMLGCIYLDGAVVDKDIDKAIKYLQSSYRHGNGYALTKLQELGLEP